MSVNHRVEAIDKRIGRPPPTRSKLGSVRDRHERDFNSRDAGGLVPLGKLTVPMAPRRPQSDECHSLEGIIAGRSPLRLATLSLPTHREVVAAAFRISALVPPN